MKPEPIIFEAFKISAKQTFNIFGATTQKSCSFRFKTDTQKFRQMFS